MRRRNGLDGEETNVSRLGRGLEHALERSGRREKSGVLVDTPERPREGLRVRHPGVRIRGMCCIAPAKRSMAGRTPSRAELVHTDELLDRLRGVRDKLALSTSSRGLRDNLMNQVRLE
jgi:hypothetical protein